MKKHLLLLLVALVALPTMARDFDYTYAGQTITYTVLDEAAKTCQIIGTVDSNGSGDSKPGNKVSGALTLPAHPSDGENEYTLTALGRSAFENCVNLTSVVIPNTVTAIGEGAFFVCRGLASVSIPNSVITFGNNVFWECTSLKEVTIPNSVIAIPYGTFCKCTGLTSVNIGSSVTLIGPIAFENCTGLTEITIPERVGYIGDRAFSGCGNLKKVNFNAVNCPVLGEKYLIFPNSVEVVEFGENVKIIPDNAFSRASKLTRVTIPNSVTHIGKYAFYGCTALAEVAMGESVAVLDWSAFDHCSSLKSINLPNSLTEIRDHSFYCCYLLEEVTFGNAVSLIGPHAFENCYSMTSVTIPNTVANIGENAFYSCDLTSVTYMADKPINADWTVFDSQAYENATLNYLKSAEAEIASTEPWSLFNNRIGRDADFDSITAVRTPADTQTAVYNMQGVRVGISTDGLPHGVYILRRGSTTSKISI